MSRRQHRTSPLALFAIFLRLGLTSFGGPVAHLGYYREEFVVRRRWLDEDSYAELIALGQFIPGPASSQTGFAIGIMRGGLLGGLAAWIAFTLPSALLMTAAAYGIALVQGPLAEGVLNGLKIVAVAVVAQAVWGMARSLCPDRARASIAVAALALLLLFPSLVVQLGVIVLGIVAGLILCPDGAGNGRLRLGDNVPMPVAVAALAVFFLLLFGLPAVSAAGGWTAVAVIDAFYRAGALVFGGGHVVLPLLEQGVVSPGWIARDDFLAGYGAAQALPGPLFAFAAYLGALMAVTPSGIAGAALCLVAVFLPGLLLVLAVLPYWDRVRHQPSMRRALAGVNAAVVGILAAALYTPIFVSAVRGADDAALAVLAFAGLVVWKLPVLVVVVATAAGGLALAVLA